MDSARASHHAKAPEVSGASSAGSLSPHVGLPSCGFDSFPGDLPPAQSLHIPQSPQSKDEMASPQHLKEHLKVQSFHQEFCTKSFTRHTPSTELPLCAIWPSSQRASRWVCIPPGAWQQGGPALYHGVVAGPFTHMGQMTVDKRRHRTWLCPSRAHSWDWGWAQCQGLSTAVLQLRGPGDSGHRGMSSVPTAGTRVDNDSRPTCSEDTGSESH